MDHHFGATPKIFENARLLKKRSTKAEDLLWNYLRNKRFFGLKFKRQFAINFFVADFYCKEKRLVIEIDGEIHLSAETKEYDKERDRILKELEITTIRFTNDDVLKDIDFVLSGIKDYCFNKK